MAVAWSRKSGTEYVKDPIFVSNFFADFNKVLGLESSSPSDFDFSEIISHIETMKLRRSAMGKEEKKQLAQERKALREKNREKYGYAIVDGIRIELGNYTVEPASIFMGRGKHPLRGKWKKAVGQNEITLNLSPDAQMPEGEWEKRVWEPDCMWVARWEDPLRSREKYIWFSDNSFVKQKRDIDKFNKAQELSSHLKAIRDHILTNLDNPDVLTKKIATVWFLIDELKFRVGDEKDEDEADTVGATTLRSEHIRFMNDGVVFRFLGKDSVEWNIKAELPEKVIKNLKEFSTSNNTIFQGVNSTNAKAFLEEVAQGFSPKVFRTYHASFAVSNTLSKSNTNMDTPLYVKKYEATLANLEAAMTCNHKRTLPKTWEASLSRMEERLKSLEAKKNKTTNEKQKAKQNDRLREFRMRIELKKKTKDYNLNTSLKSYVDPRIYYQWGKKVDFDWKNYYSTTLQRKFGWVEDKQ
jgi:DNA topoisomerase-1